MQQEIRDTTSLSARRDVSVHGRDAELEAVGRLLERARAGACGLWLGGEAGIGKTAIFDAGLDEAARTGFVPLVTRSAPGESGLAYAGLGDLLARIPGEAAADLPPPQADALAVALGLREPASPHQPRLLGQGVLGVLRRLAAEAPIVLAVDDLHWLDSASAAAVRFALRRLTDEPVAFLATTRVGPSGGEWLEEGRLDRVEVGPLSLGALQRVLRERTPAPVTRPRARQIHKQSGGNPFHALELARRVSGGSTAPAASAFDLVAARIDELPAETRSLLVVLALAARPTTDLTRALAASEALESAEQNGIVDVGEGGTIRFAHPLLATVACGRATSGERRCAHARLEQLSHDPVERAHHLAHAHDGRDEQVAERVEAAAAVALRRGAAIAAAQLAEAAVRLTPAGSPAYWSRTLDAVRRCRTIGETARARALLDELVATCADTEYRAEALRLLAALAGDEGDGSTARARIEEARALAVGDELAAAICLDAVWIEGGLGGSLAPAEAALEHATRTRNPQLRAEALTALGYASFSHGRGLRRELFEEAIALEQTFEHIDAAKRPTTRYGLVAKWAGDMTLSRCLLEEAAARAVEQEDASATVVLYYLAWLHLIAAEWSEALDRAEQAREIAVDAGRAGDAAAAQVTQAIVAGHLGRIDDGRQLLTASAAIARDSTTGLGQAYAVLWAWAAALLDLADGDAAAAASQLKPQLDTLRRRGLDEPGYHPWLPTCLDALLDAGRLDDADDLLTWFESHARRLERRWALAVAEHFRGRLAATSGDLATAVAHLERALELHDGNGRPYERARSLLLLGELHRRNKQKAGAREVLEAAAAELERLGATLWAGRARQQLAQIGGRAPTDGLTPAELRMTGLIAAGRSNKEIASELFISVRTVETTLSRIYRKLGLRSRGELAAWVSRR